MYFIAAFFIININKKQEGFMKSCYMRIVASSLLICLSMLPRPIRLPILAAIMLFDRPDNQWRINLDMDGSSYVTGNVIMQSGTYYINPGGGFIRGGRGLNTGVAPSSKVGTFSNAARYYCRGGYIYRTRSDSF